MDGQALAAVVERRAVHLVPNQLHVHNVLPLYEPGQVLLHDVARRFAPDADADANHAVLRPTPHSEPRHGGDKPHTTAAAADLQLHLHDNASQGVDAPHLAVAFVPRVHGHRRGHRAADNPMVRDLQHAQIRASETEQRSGRGGRRRT